MKIVSLIFLTLIWLSFIGMFIAMTVDYFHEYKYFVVAFSCLLSSAMTWLYILVFSEILNH